MTRGWHRMTRGWHRPLPLPLLRLVIRNIVEFAEACKPEMSVLFVRVLD